VIDNVWLAEPVFVAYVPPGVAPKQPAGALWTAFEETFHDTGCVVFPPPGAGESYAFAFLPPNLRYAPEELAGIFPWGNLVNFQRTAEPRPYGLAYALPAEGAAPSPATPHTVDWGPASLLGYDLATSETPAGGLLEVTLFFRANQPANTEQWFRLSLVDEADEEANGPLAWDEGDPCRGMYPAPLWEPGQVIAAKSIVPVPADLPAGKFGLRVSMFDLAVGADAPLAATGETVLARVTVGGD
jgi:hypothetical protein